MGHLIRGTCKTPGCKCKQQYYGKRNGKRIYRSYCEKCHGERCSGGGPISEGLIELAKRVKIQKESML